jgi:hypothetical protein
MDGDEVMELWKMTEPTEACEADVNCEESILIASYVVAYS